MNPLLVLAPSGMLAVGLASVALWKTRGGVGFGYFLWGGLVWLASVVPKVAMDLTITPALTSWAEGALGLPRSLAPIGLYAGLRTGILECGLAYLAFSRTRLRRATLREAVAFGVGFGAAEAIALAVPVAVQIAVFALNPSLLELMPEESRQIVEAQLSMPTWVVLAPIAERAFALLAHVFTALLVFASIREGRPGLLACAVLYKSALDAPVPYLNWAFEPAISPTGAYQAEAWPALMGIAALAGTKYYIERLSRTESRTARCSE